jgi:tetratricopeptide (TPR) repeat protein
MKTTSSDRSQTDFEPSQKVWYIALGGLFLLSFFLRFPYQSPSWWHVDERAFVLQPLGLWSGDLNPHFFNYPTLPFYLISLLYYGYYLISYSGSMLHFVAERYFVGGHDLIVLARSFHSLQSALTGVFCALVGRRLFGARVGLLVGISFAVLPLSVRFAHLATVDTGQVLWQVVSLYFAVHLVESGRLRDVILAGACVGLATASKYPGVLAFLPLMVACTLAPGTRRQQLQMLVLAGFGGLAAFFCTSPYVLLDYSSAWASLSSMGSEHLLSASHEGEGFSLWHHARYNLRYGVGLLGVVALVVGLFYRVGRYRAVDWILLSAVLAQLLFLSLSSSVFMRYALPLAPLVALAWGRLLWLIPKGKWVSLAVAVLLWIEPLYGSWQTRALLSGEDTRDQARAWIEENMPAGSYLIQSTLGAGKLDVMHPGGIYTRQNYFLKSYAHKDLRLAYKWLSAQDDLPPVYISFSAAIGLEQIAADLNSPYSLGLFVDIEHPLSLREGGESLDYLESICQWQTEFLCGQVEQAIFDAVDWYFLPIGAHAALEHTGPRLKLGLVPIASTRPPMSSREFFSVLHLLIEASFKMQDKADEEALEIYERIWTVPFFLDTALTTELMYDLLSNMGLAYQRTGDMQRSAQFWQKAIQLDPDRVNSYNNLGVVYAEGGNPQQALSVWQEAITRQADKADTHYNMGNTYYGVGQYAEALASWQRALELDSVYESAYYNMGNAHFKMGAWQEAIAAYQRAKRREPQRAAIYFNTAQAYIRLLQVAPAIKELEHCIELAPNDADSYYHLGDLYRSEGDLAQARVYLTRFVELVPNDRRVEGVLSLLKSAP